MRTRGQPTTQSRLDWGRRAVPAVLAALVAAVALSAAPPEDKKANEPPAPIFQPPIEIKPEYLAVLTVGNQFTPQAGPWSAVASVYGGAHPDYQVWNLRGPFSSRPGRMQVGAATLFLNGFTLTGSSPLTESATLKAGEDQDCWALINTDEVRPFPPFFLEPGRIRDRHDFATGDPEIELYAQVIVMAHYTSAKAFAAAARHDLRYVHLFNEPERHRGQVVHVSGRLLRYIPFDAPDEARAAGVSKIYEGWVMTDRLNEHPACVVFTDLPPGLKAEGEEKCDIDGVGFDGYFYKRYRYKAYDTKKRNEARDAPLLIGHTLSGKFGANAAADGEPDNWGLHPIWVFLGAVGSALVGVAGVTFWFRYHDQRVRRRILASRLTGFVPPPDEPEEVKGEQAPVNGSGEHPEGPTREPSGEAARGPLWGDFPQSPS